MKHIYEMKITEKGNGWPSAGEFLCDPKSGSIYRLISGGGRIHTDDGGNYIYAQAELIGDAWDVSEHDSAAFREVGIEQLP